MLLAQDDCPAKGERVGEKNRKEIRKHAKIPILANYTRSENLQFIRMHGFATNNLFQQKHEFTFHSGLDDLP